MRLLLIHPEARCFAGAEKLLVDFLAAWPRGEDSITLAVVRGSELDSRAPVDISRLFLPDNHRFSVAALAGQLRAVVREQRHARFDLIHGWSARDWELTALARTCLRVPAVGALHDHPQASFITPKRRRLMRWCVRWGLDRLICVSQAVQSACVEAGYPAAKLAPVLNGIPCPETPLRPMQMGAMRLGFLGAFGERKGLRGLFEMISELARLTMAPWKLVLAGAAQDDEGRRMMEEIRRQYEPSDWWPHVEWRGWVAAPMEFLKEIDLLICPSSQFEPFGLVLCEAGLARIPVLATRVGGIPEIVRHAGTGWLIEPGDWSGGARILAEALRQPERCRDFGEAGNARVRQLFTIEKMVVQYRELYSKVCHDV
ncbi:MAG: glycosyltransferase family 4 protein [Verrucomicrobia bacterium]|nr:glycosyltransferase family 4 protein [Verrucomicrobiota bacterium]